MRLGIDYFLSRLKSQRFILTKNSKNMRKVTLSGPIVLLLSLFLMLSLWIVSYDSIPRHPIPIKVSNLTLEISDAEAAKSESIQSESVEYVEVSPSVSNEELLRINLNVKDAIWRADSSEHFDGALKVKIKKLNERVVYSISGYKKEQLLSFFDVYKPVVVHVDAISGEII